MKYTYKTQGTCSSHIELEIENNIITDIAFWGGCNGNLQGFSRLVKGMSVNDGILTKSLYFKNIGWPSVLYNAGGFFFELKVWLACYYFVILRHLKNER